MVVPDWSLQHRVRHLRDLYEDLSSVFAKVVGLNGIVQGPCPALSGLPLIGVKRPNSVVLLPRLAMDTITDTVLALKTLRQVVLPIYADFQFRLGWKLFPTRSRFSFLRSLDMSGINCANTCCEAVETDRHLLFECPPAKKPWGYIATDWGAFLAGPLTWPKTCLLQHPPWTPLRAEDTETIGVLWIITCSLTLHTIWTARNKHQFENGPPLKPIPALFRIYSIFSAHFRALLRSADPSMREGLQRCLRGFPDSSRLGKFINDHPRAFSLRPRSLH